MDKSAAAKTILIVEDDAIACVGLSTILRAHGYCPVSAANAKQALDCLRAGLCPDVILLDMILPNSDGWQFMGQKQRDAAIAPIPLVLVTGLGIASKEWAIALGAVDLLRKPVDVGVLLETVRRYAEPNAISQ
jgi:CheY-like chemotaxis protein